MKKMTAVLEDVKKIPFFMKACIIINLGAAVSYFIAEQHMTGIWVLLTTAFMLLTALGQVLIDDYTKMVNELLEHCEWALKKLKEL